MRILLVEDDLRIAENIREMLTKNTYATEIAPDGQTALKLVNGNNFDLLILDWMLPDVDGTKVCKILRKQGLLTPILMLTAKTQLEDIIEGLDAGADDYLTKPFEMKELLARIRALLRRQGPATLEPQITISDLVIDTNSAGVTRAGKAIKLSPKEYAILEYLARHQNSIVNRKDLITHIWNSDSDLYSNTLDVHIRYLRQKIDTDSIDQLIHTIKSKGYMLGQKK